MNFKMSEARKRADLEFEKNQVKTISAQRAIGDLEIEKKEREDKTSRLRKARLEREKCETSAQSCTTKLPIRKMLSI